MLKINTNFQKLSGSYLFSAIAKKIENYKNVNPDKDIIRLGIGDVTRPLTKSVIDALHTSVDEMAHEETFRGYAPDLGYSFLREAIAKNDFEKRGCDISADEIFISDGAKCDSGNIQELFSLDNTVGVCDPVYPVYVDSNVMAGRAGDYIADLSKFSNITYMLCSAKNNFAPNLPEVMPDIIYLCFPNNPTGATMKKSELQKWVDAANASKSVIIYDAAYEAYIREDDVPHSIYECGGAKTCAIELRSFSKTAGFTGLRLGYAVVPKDLIMNGYSLHDMWARRHGTKYNGAPYIVQRAGEAVYFAQGQEEVKGLVNYYMQNCDTILNGLKDTNLKLFGGINAPYIWLKTPDNMTGWDFFDFLLEKANVVGTPGEGFGPGGNGYFRLTAFGKHENTVEAVKRIRNVL
ncbi:LL-diaminopimelate aminotransferase [Lachnoanaerobaculum saburreum]|uniref:LL-diaminopimelate aminotransferase n=1 Tax=Lachnoanaerobaculum saburreum TaxID=467210 RepID=A0A133ZLU8_9FIRM|nr:LL-diaminopimelate aminotransferase [Lachnoanaerobaculum saburreum]KXB56390.1 LL-diaminopimelate aminotransferase [Lachnoanaerobaculum saburreum]